MKCPQLSKPEATAVTEWRKKPWEKPGSVGGPVLLWPDEPAVQFQLHQFQIVQRTHLVPVVFTMKHKYEWTTMIKTRTVCNNTKHNTRGQKSARPSEHETACSHNKTEHGAWVSEPWHETETQDMSAGIRTPRSNTKQGTQMREHTGSRTLTWKQDMTGMSGLYHKPWITLDWSDRTLTLGNTLRCWGSIRKTQKPRPLSEFICRFWLILPEDEGRGRAYPLDGQGQPGGGGEDRGERQHHQLWKMKCRVQCLYTPFLR